MPSTCTSGWACNGHGTELSFTGEAQAPGQAPLQNLSGGLAWHPSVIFSPPTPNTSPGAIISTFLDRPPHFNTSPFTFHLPPQLPQHHNSHHAPPATPRKRHPQKTLHPPPPLRPNAPAPEQTRAIQHAQTLLSQNGRDVQPPVPIEIYERLCELPRHRAPPFSASSPSPQDASEFLSLVPDFLPREYLDLIEERNCTGLCGYALCGRPRRRVAATYKILRTGIADADEVNKWCSEGCARRAYYVKVQLDDPSYVVRGETKVKVELMEEREARPPQREEQRVDGGKAGVNAAALAAERGEAAVAGRMMELTIREKGTVAPATAPAEGARGEDAHLMLEGHRTAFGTGQDEMDMDMDDDDDYLPATIRM